MAGFDPARFLAETAPAPSAGFDPARFLAETQAPTPREPTGVLGALRRGATQGATLGFGDEITGALAAPILKGIGYLSETPAYQQFADKPIGQMYRQSRDMERADNATAKQDHPVAYTGSEIVGGIAPTLLLPSAKLAQGAGFAARALAGAKTVGLAGALAGLGNSTADTAGGLAADTAIGGVAGAGLGVAGAGLGSVAARLAARARGGVQAAETKAGDMAAKKVGEEIATARGALGGETQKANRMVENLMRLEQSLTPEQAAAMRELEDAGILPGLRQKLAESTLQSIPGAAGTIETKAAALQALQEGAGAATEAEAKRLLSFKAAAHEVGVRAKRYGLPMAGSAAGAVLGGPAGATIGALAGAGTRPAARSWMNLVTKYPAVQKTLWNMAGWTASKLSQATGTAAPGALTPETLDALAAYLRLRPMTPAAADGEQ